MLFRHVSFVTAVAAVLALPTAGAAQPAFLQWYHAYDAPIATCSELIKEAAGNVSADSGDVKKYQAKVGLNGARGIMRCLSRGSGKSWVVILAYADQRAPAKEIFERMRLVICGDCADFDS